VLNLSIKGKLTLIIMGASLVALLLVSAGFVAYELITFQTTTRQDLSSLAEIIALQSAAPLTQGDEGSGRTILGVLSAKKHIQTACLYQGARPFATYYAPGQNLQPVPPRPEPDGCRFEKDHVVLFKGIESHGKPIGTLYLKSDLLEKRARLQLCAAMITLSILVSTVVTFLLSSWLQRIISRPISHLVETAKIVSAQKNYSVRAEKHSHDELGELIDGFNEMLGQIQQGAAALQAANDQLEQRVQERTQDMQLQITERERMEAALQEQFTRTNLLNQITQVISERQDLESILYVVLRQLEDFLAIDLGTVCLFDHGADTLNIAALRVKNPLLASKLDLREGVVMSLEQAGLKLCKHGEVVHMPDTYKIHAHLAEHLASVGFRSTAAVPLMVENKLFGVLMIARLNPDAISTDECEFLHTLSDHVALATHRAQLHAELEKAYNELRQTQNTVMQTERLKALGQMASGIAHDVNNALSPIVGFADLLSKSEPTLSANGQKYLQFIRTAGDDIAHIVARLREFYRQRNAREALAALNLNELARQVIDMTRPRWRDIPQGRGLMIEMHTDFDANLPELAGIESEVREALTNLIINAVDAIPGGGTITVRTRVGLRERSDQAPGTPSHVVLEVHDTGIGMDENTRKHCLEPFFSTKGQRGTGLGLAMVYGVMERHEGRIEVESEVGRGTAVKLIFPVRRLAGPGALEPARQEAFLPLHILCIDDEPLLRELMREVLEREGHKVEVCDSGQGGVTAFRSATSRGRPFDVVFTDLGMPYFDGRQVAKVLKRESPATPVIMLTGWGAFMKEDGEVPPQVDGILSKPPRSTEIRETLQRVMHRRKAASRDPADTSVILPTTSTA
jgi:signal transduction histidine kinase/FixJ family two-component response regulator